jgi:hypothetical protein
MRSFARLFFCNAIVALGAAALMAGFATRADAAFPLPQPGYKALFMYTGLRTLQSDVSVMLFCTNLDTSKSVQVRWDVVDYDGLLLVSDSFDAPIPPGQSKRVAIGTGNPVPALYPAPPTETSILLRDPLPAAMRVSANGSSKVICDVLVVDVDGAKPSFTYAPRQFTGVGKR